MWISKEVKHEIVDLLLINVVHDDKLKISAFNRASIMYQIKDAMRDYDVFC